MEGYFWGFMVAAGLLGLFIGPKILVPLNPPIWLGFIVSLLVIIGGAIIGNKIWTDMKKHKD